jgi:ribonuclease R
MAKACYSTDNIGHYGLAFKFYTHFTSPIRRYPDVMVHRLLALYLHGADSQSLDYYTAQCKHASEREVIAAEAERESVKYKLVEFMEDKVGQEFDGHVSGVTQWGIYVEIEPTKIEGMIPYRTIRSDFYDFDEDHYRAVGRRHHGVIKLGDPLRIRVKGTNLEQKLLDYELVEPEMENTPTPSEDEYIESLVDAPMPPRPRKPARAPRKGSATPRKGALKAEREKMKKGGKK